MRKFFAQSVDARNRREATIGDDVIQGLKDLGLFGLLVPPEHGGINLSATGYARVMQEVSSLDGSLAVTLGAHQSIGMKGLLLFGNEELKKKYLPRLATGELVAAFALTEPSAGSDAAAIQTRAEVSPDGKHYTLTGSKIWISNAGFADLFTIFARTSPAEHGQPRITVLVGARWGSERPQRAQARHPQELTTEISFENMRVPAENVLGGWGAASRYHGS